MRSFAFSLASESSTEGAHAPSATSVSSLRTSSPGSYRYEPGEDVRKEETEVAEGACAPSVDDSDAKEKAKERMKQKMMQMTKDFDAKRQGRQAK